MMHASSPRNHQMVLPFLFLSFLFYVVCENTESDQSHHAYQFPVILCLFLSEKKNKMLDFVVVSVI